MWTIVILFGKGIFFAQFEDELMNVLSCNEITHHKKHNLKHKAAVISSIFALFPFRMSFF